MTRLTSSNELDRGGVYHAGSRNTGLQRMQAPELYVHEKQKEHSGQN